MFNKGFQLMLQGPSPILSPRGEREKEKIVAKIE
jgi:hypothetical protein